MVNELRKQLLQTLLTSQGFVSGEELSRQFNVSRTAIWKHIEELRREGYEIEAVRKQGYKLVGQPGKLSPSAISAGLRTKWVGTKLHYYETVESTQQIAHRLAREGAAGGTVVLANHQEQGRGRLGRSWFSPPGKGIWLSLIERPPIPITEVSQLTLLTAVAVHQAVKRVANLELSIKWPNDLLYQHRKVAGILTELHAEADQVNYVIIGIGLNVNQEEGDFPPQLSAKATSLALASGDHQSRTDLTITLLEEWEKLYTIYLHDGFRPIKTMWEASACSMGHRIVARTPRGRVEGLALGITDEGALLMEDDDGRKHKIYSADIETK